MRTVLVASVVFVGGGVAAAQPPEAGQDFGAAPASEPAAPPQESTAEVATNVEIAPPSSVAVVRPSYTRPKRHDPLATTERWGGGVRLTGLTGIGALPGVNFGGEVAINVRREELFGELAMARWTPEENYYVVDAGESRPLRLDVWTLRVGWASMKMPLRAWALAEVGELASLPGMQAMPGVVTRMVMGETPSVRRWEAVGAGLGVAWPMSNQARLVGNMEIAVPTTGEQQLDVNGYGAYQPEVMAARFNAGLEVGWR